MTSGLRWTKEQFEAHRASARDKAATTAGTSAGKPSLPADVAKIVRAHEATKRFQALGRMPKSAMNKTEAAYAELLEQQRQVGQVLWWKFHPMNVRLASGAFYEVDFLVMHADMGLAIHETKGGFTTDKGQLKIRLAAEAMPVFRFFKVTKLPKKEGGGWKREEF